MGLPVILAHGGPLGAALELGFVLVPILIFVVLSRISRRRREAEDPDETGTDAEADGDGERR